MYNITYVNYLSLQCDFYWPSLSSINVFQQIFFLSFFMRIYCKQSRINCSGLSGLWCWSPTIILYFKCNRKQTVNRTLKFELDVECSIKQNYIYIITSKLESSQRPSLELWKHQRPDIRLSFVPMRQRHSCKLSACSNGWRYRINNELVDHVHESRYL
jgi:hypothetical protein